jgi:hypothetical protein
MSDTPRTDEVLEGYDAARSIMLEKLAKELERELNESIKVIRDADLALHKCLNYLIVQPIFTRNKGDIERESETMESVHLALAKLQPFITP